MRPDTLHGDRRGARRCRHREGGGLPADRPLHPADRFAGVTTVGRTALGEVPHDGCPVIVPNWLRVVLAIVCGFTAWFSLSTVGHIVIRLLLSDYAQVAEAMDFYLVMLLG